MIQIKPFLFDFTSGPGFGEYYKGFHTFGFEWTEKNYAFYIDGLKFFEVNEGISKIDQYIILSMEIRDKLEGFKKAVAPDTFKIDYVKVYKK